MINIFRELMARWRHRQANKAMLSNFKVHQDRERNRVREMLEERRQEDRRRGDRRSGERRS